MTPADYHRHICELTIKSHTQQSLANNTRDNVNDPPSHTGKIWPTKETLCKLWLKYLLPQAGLPCTRLNQQRSVLSGLSVGRNDFAFTKSTSLLCSFSGCSEKSCLFFSKTSFVNPFLFKQSSYSALPSPTDKDGLGANSQHWPLLCLECHWQTAQHIKNAKSTGLHTMSTNPGSHQLTWDILPFSLQLWAWTVSKKLTQLSKIQTYWHFIWYLKVTTNKQIQKVVTPNTIVQLQIHSNIDGRIRDLEAGIIGNFLKI